MMAEADDRFHPPGDSNWSSSYVLGQAYKATQSNTSLAPVPPLSYDVSPARTSSSWDSSGQSSHPEGSSSMNPCADKFTPSYPPGDLKSTSQEAHDESYSRLYALDTDGRSTPPTFHFLPAGAGGTSATSYTRETRRLNPSAFPPLSSTPQRRKELRRKRCRVNEVTPQSASRQHRHGSFPQNQQIATPNAANTGYFRPSSPLIAASEQHLQLNQPWEGFTGMVDSSLATISRAQATYQYLGGVESLGTVQPIAIPSVEWARLSGIGFDYVHADQRSQLCYPPGMRFPLWYCPTSTYGLSAYPNVPDDGMVLPGPLQFTPHPQLPIAYENQFVELEPSYESRHHNAFQSSPNKIVSPTMALEAVTRNHSKLLSERTRFSNQRSRNTRVGHAPLEHQLGPSRFANEGSSYNVVGITGQSPAISSQLQPETIFKLNEVAHPPQDNERRPSDDDMLQGSSSIPSRFSPRQSSNVSNDAVSSPDGGCTTVLSSYLDDQIRSDTKSRDTQARSVEKDDSSRLVSSIAESGTWSHSKSWTSLETKERQLFQRMMLNLHYIGADKSPFIPQSPAELTAYRAEAAEKKSRKLILEVTRRLERSRFNKTEHTTAPDKHCRTMQLYGGKSIDDGLSAVLAIVTCFNSRSHLKDNDQYPSWPSLAEMKEEGSRRALCGGRAFPPPRSKRSTRGQQTRDNRKVQSDNSSMV